MTSLKCSVSLDTYDSKKLNSVVNSLQFSDKCLIFAFTAHPHSSISCIVNPFSKLKQISVSRLDTEISDVSESNHVDRLNDESVVLQSPNFNRDFRKGRRNIWKRLHGVKSVNKEARLKPSSRSENDGNLYEREQESILAAYRGESVNMVLENENLSEDKLSAIGPELSSERCNFILQELERSSDDKALRFFDWMRRNGKLKENVNAYKLVLRVLGRKQEWEGAEMIIQEMQIESGCELSFQIFNTLIYACHKRGLVEIGAKWFQMMLDKGVWPNAATFGMLMSLYQKGCVVNEAEFTFSQMRNLKIICHTAYSAMITIYIRCGLYDKAEEVIGFLRKDRVILNKENWLVLLNAYSQQGKLDDAEKVFVKMHEVGFSPHIVAYNTLITGYGKVSNMEAAQRIFWNIENAGLEPDETTYRSMIEGWGRVQDFKEAEWYYKKLKSSGFRPNSSNLYTMINLQAKHGDEVGAVRTINDMMLMGCQYSSILSIVLQAYEKAGRVDKVAFVVKGLFHNHVLNNQTSCSILVMAYVKNCLVDDAIEVLKSKQWEDRVFEDNLYHLLICYCKELGFLENSVNIYTSMPKSKKPNLHITCTMIDVYSCLSRFKEAENLYLKLKSKGIILDLIAVSIIVRMYVKSGSLNDACSVLDEMDKQKNIVPDIYLLRDMLRLYQRLGMVSKLADLYYKILKAEVSWDQEMYNCVINCCARALPIDELSRVFNEMIQRGFSPNTTTFNVMLDVYGKARLFKKARRVFWMAKRRGVVDVVSYNTIVAAYGQSKDFKNMASIVRKMKFNGFSVSLEVYNCMLDAYGKKGEMEKFKNVLQRMKESNRGSDHYTYNIMINIYGEKGWIEEVADVLMELKESGLKLDLCSYNSLIKAYGTAGMVEDAVALVKEMRENGIEPDRITYINLITALQKNDKVLEALKWSLWMKQMGI